MMLSTDSLEQWRVFVLSTWLAAMEDSLIMMLSTDSLEQWCVFVLSTWLAAVNLASSCGGQFDDGAKHRFTWAINQCQSIRSCWSMVAGWPLGQASSHLHNHRIAPHPPGCPSVPQCCLWGTEVGKGSSRGRGRGRGVGWHQH